MNDVLPFVIRTLWALAHINRSLHAQRPALLSLLESCISNQNTRVNDCRFARTLSDDVSALYAAYRRSLFELRESCQVAHLVHGNSRRRRRRTRTPSTSHSSSGQQQYTSHHVMPHSTLHQPTMAQRVLLLHCTTSPSHATVLHSTTAAASSCSSTSRRRHSLTLSPKHQHGDSKHSAPDTPRRHPLHAPAAR